MSEEPGPARFDTGYHAPVLVDEVVGILRDAKTMLDGTLGGGGHTMALLEAGVGRVVGIDRDPEALVAARARLAKFAEQGRFEAHAGNYADVDRIPSLEEARFDGVLLDLGISSRQVDAEGRGFTFRRGAPLDMRMEANGSDASAADFLNDAEVEELARVFRDYADEKRGMRLAREIVRRRETQPFATSDDLVNAIRAALGPRTGPGDFARLFQAIRIQVNDEIGGLERALPMLRERLAPGGILAIITYHSVEDRLVKHTLREWSTDCICPPRQPVCTCNHRALGETLTKKPIVPRPEEIERNPRSRSAKLRAWRAA